MNSWSPNREHPSNVKPYDAYHPEAHAIYWDHLNKGLFPSDMDGWWMDSTEPGHLDAEPENMDNQTCLGSFRKVHNVYPLVTIRDVYDNQRAISSDKRVFILTHLAFAGQQRYGANTWAGDVQTTWDSLARRITAGLNFSLYGTPRWNSDIGDFFLGSYPRKLKGSGYHELLVRRMQFGTFNSMMRSHGADASCEIWQFGQKGDRIYDAIEEYIHLRYNLLPYTYSTSWNVTANQSSVVRALVMDLKNDKKVWNITDQFMFGKALLVCPVMESQYIREAGERRNPIRTTNCFETRSKPIYLPQGTQWYDFRANEKYQGDRTIERETPIDIIPLFVKAGPILPIGPKAQYITEKAQDNLELRIYTGVNDHFVPYEDEFDNCNYEKSAYTEITMTWNDALHILTIGTCKEFYKGMLQSRTFTVRL